MCLNVMPSAVTWFQFSPLTVWMWFQDEESASVSSSDAGLGSEHESEAAAIGELPVSVQLVIRSP